MPTANDLKGLISFVERPDWAERFRIVLDDHFGPVLDPADMGFDELRNLLGDPMTMTLWGCAFEDFLTQDFEIGGNVVDDYLKRRGFKEGARTKAYMQAIRTSVMSLYEVVDVVPGTAKGVRQRDISERLDRIETLEPESARFWNWLEAPAAETVGDGIRVLGNVELSGRSLLLSVNSAARAERGASLLTAALGDLVGAPTTTTETAEAMRTKQSSRPAAASTSEPPSEAETRLMHDHLDGIYRRTLDEPVGMLGDLMPRQAVKTAAGRRKAAEWLKHLENQSAHRPPDDPLATYSFLWLWEELGIADLRQ